jgi:phage tail sheath protein FI
MAASFLHGVETIDIDSQAGSIQVVKSSIIALVGIAPKGNGGVPTKTLVSAEVKATGTINFQTGVAIGSAVAIYAGSEFICQYTRVSGDSTLTLLAASLATAINATSTGYTATSSGVVLTVTYKAGAGASANGVQLAISSPDPNGVFANGADAVYTVVVSSNPQALTLCLSDKDDAQFGKPVKGFNIPRTLEIIRAIAGNTPVVVVNVFDFDAHTSSVTDEVQTLVAGKCTLAFAPIGDITIKTSGGTVIPTMVGIDYKLDAYGNFQKLNNRIGDTDTLKFTYKKLNVSAVTAANIIGEIDPVTNTRTGTKLLDLCYSTFGFTPKILISPTFITNANVAVAFRSLANKFRAIYLQDAPLGATIQQVLAGRNNTTINFNTDSKRAVLLYPQTLVTDTGYGGSSLYPYSAVMAGLIAWNDKTNGYWTSPSNQSLSTITGVEVNVSYQINDSSCEANVLNSVGVTTIKSSYGTGFKTHGNRSAAWPTQTDVRNFINLQRLDDMICESMELDAEKDLDKGITPAFISVMKQKGNNLMKKLIKDGAVQPGSRVVYNPADNPPSELAQGHITFTRIYMGVTPAERITYNNVIDVSLLGSLNK